MPRRRRRNADHVAAAAGAPTGGSPSPPADTVQDILRLLDPGSSVAEYDEALEDHFVETDVFRALVADRADIVAGDKGTGKTALYRMLQQRYPHLLAKVDVLAGFNPAGTPIFQRLAEGEPLSEGQYVTIWKAYCLSLAGNWILADNAPVFSHGMDELDKLLTKAGLRSTDGAASTILSQAIDAVRRIAHPKGAEIATSFTPEGHIVISPRVEFGDAIDAGGITYHDEALRVLDALLAEIDHSVWIALDRLDEAFQGFPNAEKPVLRALLRTYLDLAEFKRLRLKLFVRKDLFRRVVDTGFVNLTHVNARKVEIVWDDEDLMDLLCRRFRRSGHFVDALGASFDSRANEALFYAVFPRHVDPGSRSPTTWNWMLARIRDGNGVAAPRNLIDLVKKAQEAQQRMEHRVATPHDAASDRAVIQSRALKRGLSALSDERVADTLLAEAGQHVYLIEKFRDGRAEHNDCSLAKLLDLPTADVRAEIKPLVDLGFLQVGETLKIPMLYRGGLGIRQGKAFAANAGSDRDKET